MTKAVIFAIVMQLIAALSFAQLNRVSEHNTISRLTAVVSPSISKKVSLHMKDADGLNRYFLFLCNRK